MKRIAMVGLVIIMVMAAVALSGCGYNRDLFDTVYRYDEAIIQIADGTIVRGEVQNWRDYDGSDQIQVRVDDVTYLVHSVNVTLIHK